MILHINVCLIIWEKRRLMNRLRKKTPQGQSEECEKRPEKKEEEERNWIDHDWINEEAIGDFGIG